jgi:hypothetical protein
MTAIQRFRQSLQAHDVDDSVVEQIFEGYERISDRTKKERRAAFFVQAIERMDQLLDAQLCHDIRDACACSKGGWRLRKMQEIARECQGQSVAQTLESIGKANVGNPTLTDDGMILTGVGAEGGFPCPCPVFQGVEAQEVPSVTYCYCCAGHFRYLYQIALDRVLRTRGVLSSALESRGKEPCRFLFEIVE